MPHSISKVLGIIMIFVIPLVPVTSHAISNDALTLKFNSYESNIDRFARALLNGDWDVLLKISKELRKESKSFFDLAKRENHKYKR